MTRRSKFIATQMQTGMTLGEAIRYADDANIPHAHDLASALLAALKETTRELRLLNLAEDGTQRLNTPAYRAISLADVVLSDADSGD